LIGLNVQRQQRAEGIGFAIPVKQVAATLMHFFSPEAYSWWFGAPLKPGFAPLTIAEVQPGSPAAKAGLQPGMRIIEVGGETPRTVVDFKEQMLAGGEPHEVAMVVQDGEKTRPVRVRLEAFDALVLRRTGLTLQEITPRSAAQLGLSEENKGLLITAVAKGSPAEAAELKPGMLLTAVDGTGLSAMNDFGLALTKKGADEKMPLGLILLQRVSPGFVQSVQARAELKLRGL
jgi:S1-C subfamily serine protease